MSLGHEHQDIRIMSSEISVILNAIYFIRSTSCDWFKKHRQVSGVIIFIQFHLLWRILFLFRKVVPSVNAAYGNSYFVSKFRVFSFQCPLIHSNGSFKTRQDVNGNVVFYPLSFSAEDFHPKTQSKYIEHKFQLTSKIQNF